MQADDMGVSSSCSPATVYLNAFEVSGFSLANQRQATKVILIQSDAVKALEAFAVINLSTGCDRLIFAAVAT